MVKTGTRTCSTICAARACGTKTRRGACQPTKRPTRCMSRTASAAKLDSRIKNVASQPVEVEKNPAPHRAQEDAPAGSRILVASPCQDGKPEIERNTQNGPPRCPTSNRQLPDSLPFVVEERHFDLANSAQCFFLKKFTRYLCKRTGGGILSIK